MSQESAAVTPLADRAVRRGLAPREAAARDEVQRLLDAALHVMRRNGGETPPRVADIVAEAGLSNQTFYRHFAGRDELVAAVTEAGALRLASYIEHQMDKEPTPEGRIRRWVEAILSQAGKSTVAHDTRAVMGMGGVAPERGGSGFAVTHIRTLLIAPLHEAGSPDPERDAAVVASAVFGRLQFHLWVSPPTPADIEHLVLFCLNAVGASDG